MLKVDIKHPTFKLAKTKLQKYRRSYLHLPQRDKNGYA